MLSYLPNWEEQWKMHAHHFYNGLARIPLPNYSKKILLKPGPGFGDLSHPTTRLMIQLMQKHSNYAAILDVGCGSGILSFIAQAYGAKTIYGIDIDQSSIEHAKENAYLNEMQNIGFMTTSEYLSLNHIPQVLLINMIRSEQKMAWSSLSPIHQFSLKVISSGVLKEEKERYLKECSERNWQPLEEFEEEGWLAFLFQQCSRALFI